MKSPGTILLLCCLLASANRSFATDTTKAVKGGFIVSSNPAAVRDQFQSPPMEYAPHAFWFWNEKLNPKHERAMAREMGRQGLNPGYVHPRHLGLEHAEGLPVTQWLSPEYFNSLRGVLEECDAAGTYLGFSDEYWWPSGRIGGRMVTEHPDMAARELTWEKWSKNGPWTVYLPPCKFIVACQEATPGVIDFQTLEVISTGKPREWTVPSGQWALFIFQEQRSPSRDRGPDDVLVNYMEPKLVGHTIEMGLEPYAKNLGAFLGHSLRYAFSDNEGEYGNRLPWSDNLLKVYRELYGEDIRKFMPLLLSEDTGGHWVTARYRWFNMVSEIYANRFWKPMNDWLAQRGLYYVSNFWEADLRLQAATVGDYFRVNRAFSMPGNDALMMNARDPLQFKEIESICEFEGRPFMSEIMGVQGWQQLPTEMKQVANFVTAWGVTHIVPHGISTNQDVTRTLHPADWFDQNPYWRTMREWTDFCRRASYVNRQSQLSADILIYNPMTSIWSLSDNFLSGRARGRSDWGNPLAQAIDNAYYGMQEKLTDKNIEYLIADDLYLREATIRDDPARPVLQIRGRQFQTLILPPLHTVVTPLYERMVAFAEAGGQIILMGQLPVASTEVGFGDPNIRTLSSRLLAGKHVVAASPGETNIEKISASITARTPRPFRFESGTFPVVSGARLLGPLRLYWLANNTGKPQVATISFPVSGSVEKWDCETGNISALSAVNNAGETSVSLSFGAYEGFWLVIDPALKSSTSRVDPAASSIAQAIPISPDAWSIQVESREVPVTAAEVSLAGELAVPGEPPPPGKGFQSIAAPLHLRGTWAASWITARANLGRAHIIFDFEMPTEARDGVLNITSDGGFTVFLNGARLGGPTPGVHWKTPTYFDITPHLRKGRNRIAIESGKFISPGEYWLLAQGNVRTIVGLEIPLRSGATWLASDTPRAEWRSPDGSTAGFSPVNPHGWNLSWNQKGEVRPPVSRLLSDQELVWLRFEVPPGATQFQAPKDLSATEIWIDGKPVAAAAEGPSIFLPASATTLALKAPRSVFAGWDRPGAFVCSKKASRPLANWDHWGLDRYSGFVSYETVVALPALQSGERVTLDLGKLEHVAQVTVNGQDAGSRMWPPFTFDITKHVTVGANTLALNVGNLITNRLAIADDFGGLYRWGNRRIPGLRYFQAGLEGPCFIRILRTSSPPTPSSPLQKAAAENGK